MITSLETKICKRSIVSRGRVSGSLLFRKKFISLNRTINDVLLKRRYLKMGALVFGWLFIALGGIMICKWFKM